MLAAMSDTPQPTYGGIAAWARLVGGLWLGVLGVVTLATGKPTHPVWLWVLVAAVVGWVVVAFRWGRIHPQLTMSTSLLAVDAALAAAAIVGPHWAGTPVLFYGGFPLLVVAVATLVSPRRGFLVATLLTIATAYRVLLTGSAGVADAISQVIGYLLSAFIVSRVLAAMRRSTDARREAEAAMARAEERAAMANHLHDSVLQTLALVQRDSTDPARVAGLAKKQERELRDWLYGDAKTSRPGLAEGLRNLAEEIEEIHRVRVEVVTVGDAAYSSKTEAAIAAAREALVNAAKHSRSEMVHLYGESKDGRISLYVRDRGVGFDPDAASAGQGIPHSIVARVEAVGGSASIESSLGRGTEVRISVDA